MRGWLALLAVAVTLTAAAAQRHQEFSRRRAQCRVVTAEGLGSAEARCSLYDDSTGKPTDEEQTISGGCTTSSGVLTTSTYSVVTSTFLRRSHDLIGYKCASTDAAATVEASVLCCSRNQPTTRPSCHWEVASGSASCPSTRQQAIGGGCLTDIGVSYSNWMAGFTGWDCSANFLNIGTATADSTVLCCDQFMRTTNSASSVDNVNRHNLRLRSALRPQPFVRCETRSAFGASVECPFHKRAVSGSCYDTAREPLTASTFSEDLLGWQCDGASTSTLVASVMCCERLVW